MLPNVNQDELAYDDSESWDQRTREKSKAYAAFLIFRDLGRGRSVLKAYQKWRAQQRPEEVEAENEPSNSAPPNWRRWFVTYEWQKRAIAWDKVQQQTREERDAKVEIELFENRRKQKELLDAMRWKRIQAMGDLIDSTVAAATPAKAGGPAVLLAKQKVEKETVDGKTTNEVDLVRQLEVLCEQERALVRDYFGDTSAQGEMEPGQVPMPVVGADFAWIPDPALQDTDERSDILLTPASISSTEAPPDLKD